MTFSQRNFILYFFLTATNALWFDLCGNGTIVSCTSGDMQYILNISTSISNCTFVNCPSVMVTSQIQLNISDVEFINSFNDLSGGSLSVTGGQISLERVKYTNCSTSASGGVVDLTYATLLAVGVVFSNCSAGYNAGGISSLYSTVSVEDVQFLNCSAFSQGGAIYLESGTLSIVNTLFTYCNAGQGGGAISMYNTTLTMQNVEFSSCFSGYAGALQMSDTSATITDSRFTSCRATEYGGGISASEANLSIVNVNFTNCTAVSNAGGITAYDGVLSIQDTIFHGCSAIQAGALDVEISTFTGLNILFKDNRAVTFAGAILLDHVSGSCVKCNFENNNVDGEGAGFHIQSSNFHFSDGYCMSQVAYWGGFATVRDASTLYINNYTITNTSAQNGGVIHAVGASKVFINNVHTVNCTAITLGGCFFIDTAGSIECVDCLLQHCTSKISGGVAALTAGSSLTLNQNLISRSEAQKNGGAFNLEGFSNLIIDNSSIRSTICGVDGGVFYLSRGSTLVCKGSTILQSFLKAGSGGVAYILKSNATFVNSTLSQSNAKNGGAIAIYDSLTNSNFSTVVLRDGCNISNTVATSYGGAIYIDGMGVLILENSVSIKNASATLGAGIYTIKFPSIFINASDNETLLMENLTASKGKAIYLGGTEASDIIVQQGSKGVELKGDIYVANSLLAKKLNTLGTLHALNAPNVAGNPVTINFTSAVDATRTFQPRDTLPQLSVYAIDGFGNKVGADVANLVVVRITMTDLEKNSPTNIQGKLMVPILNNDSASFENINFVADPGHYQVRLTAIYGLDESVQTSQFQFLNITVQSCPIDTRYFAENGGNCFPVSYTSIAARYFFGVIAVLFSLFGIACTVLLVRFKEYPIIKAGSFLFTTIATVGSTVAFLSVIAKAIEVSWSCVLSNFLQYVSFMAVFSAILLKTFRIYMIFDLKRKRQQTKYKDEVMARYFLVVMVVMIVLLVTWSILKPPTAKDTLVLTSFVTVDRCYTDDLSIMAIIISVIIVLIAAFLAFKIRKLPADFNESSYLGITTYNWIIFGAALLIIGELAVVDPTVSFSIWACSVLVPHITTMVLLTVIKLVKCFREGDRPTSVDVVKHMNTRASGVASSSKTGGSKKSSNLPSIQTSAQF